jgi:dUTP pyrophosphatase
MRGDPSVDDGPPITRSDPRVGGVQWAKVDDRAQPPYRAYPGDAGWDLATIEQVYVSPLSYADVRTGLAVAMPDGYYMRLVGRSSTFRKRGLLVVEGIIDAGFRGELFVCVYNPHPVDGVQVEAGERLMQGIVQPFYQPEWRKAKALPSSARGHAGFGSSGS